MRRLGAALALALLAGCASSGPWFREAGPPPPAEARALADWPWQEIWTGIVFQGRKIGFARLALRPAAVQGRWEIESESALRLRFLGVDKRVSLRALDEVHDDLTLQRFRYEYYLDGSRLHVEGERAGDVLVVRTESAGVRGEQRLRLREPAVPASALALLPARRGLRVGETARATVFVGESQSLAGAGLRALAYERSPLFEGAALRVATTLLGLETVSWYGAKAQPLLDTAQPEPSFLFSPKSAAPRLDPEPTFFPSSKVAVPPGGFLTPPETPKDSGKDAQSESSQDKSAPQRP